MLSPFKMKQPLVFLFGIALLSVLSIAHAGSAAFLSRRKKPVLKTSPAIFQIRGGAGPLDPTMTTKVATVLGTAQGVVTILAPTVAINRYGYSTTKINELLMQNVGAHIVSTMLYFYYLTFKETSVLTAAGSTYIPWLLMTLQRILTGDALEAGVDNSGQIFLCATSAFMMYACTQSWGVKAVKATTVLWLLCAVHLIVHPESAAKLWGLPENSMDSYETRRLFRAQGFLLGSTATVSAAMVFDDKPPLEAIGYAALVDVLMGLFNLIDNKKRGNPLAASEGPTYFWLLVHTTLVVTLLL